MRDIVSQITEIKTETHFISVEDTKWVMKRRLTLLVQERTQLFFFF